MAKSHSIPTELREIGQTYLEAIATHLIENFPNEVLHGLSLVNNQKIARLKVLENLSSMEFTLSLLKILPNDLPAEFHKHHPMLFDLIDQFKAVTSLLRSSDVSMLRRKYFNLHAILAKHPDALGSPFNLALQKALGLKVRNDVRFFNTNDELMPSAHGCDDIKTKKLI